MGASAVLADDWPEPYESYFLFLGDYPSEEELGYTEECQGIAHDSENWYITQDVVLWKIPVTCDLNRDPDKNPCPNTLSQHINDTPLGGLGYNHYGDLDYHEHAGEGYLVIPVEPLRPPAIAIIRARDLVYMGHDFLSGQGYIHAAWCAVDDNDVLYGSNDTVTAFYKYKIDWNLVEAKAGGFLSYEGEFPLYRDAAMNPLQLEYMQGGEFSESGKLLYVSNGDAESDCDCGIHVLDAQTGIRLASSTDGYGHFNYEYSPGSPNYEEPEGLTIWDLDDREVPGITGQLHVILLDNDWEVGNDDDIYIKHYSETIHVDGAHTGDENGTPAWPFNTVAEANTFAWDGSRIKIRAGSYQESVTFSKQIQLLPWEGTATVGVSGRVSLSPNAAINLAKDGVLRLY
jgi:hypothetical protein